MLNTIDYCIRLADEARKDLESSQIEIEQTIEISEKEKENLRQLLNLLEVSKPEAPDELKELRGFMEKHLDDILMKIQRVIKPVFLVDWSLTMITCFEFVFENTEIWSISRYPRDTTLGPRELEESEIAKNFMKIHELVSKALKYAKAGINELKTITKELEEYARG